LIRLRLSRSAQSGTEIEKTVFMVQGQNTTVIEYRVSGMKELIKAQMEIRPLIAFRDYHSLTHENGAINGRIDEQAEQISISPYPSLPSLYLANNPKDRTVNLSSCATPPRAHYGLR
jgi:hypothetical protein